MTVFSNYARYYDLLYQEKDYAAEAAFVLDRLAAGGKPPASILELGSGTGRHAIEFARSGCQVTGIDLSARMAEIARDRAAATGLPGLRFETGDVRHWRSKQHFAAVVSLFHVMSYQVSNADLRAAFDTAHAHLESGGRFFFDFWFGPAVLSDPPTVRIKRIEDGEIKVIRLAEPASDCASNSVTVNYEVLIEDRRSGNISRLAEQHQMRYLFLPELELLLDSSGFDLVASGCWMNLARVDSNCWYAWVMGQKR